LYALSPDHPGVVPSYPLTHMDATARAITALLLENWPNTYCYPCLAAKLQIAEKNVREAAQELALLHGFQIRHLRCAQCGRLDNLLHKVLAG
jgi:biotin operon repressor